MTACLVFCGIDYVCIYKAVEVPVSCFSRLNYAYSSIATQAKHPAHYQNEVLCDSLAHHCRRCCLGTANVQSDRSCCTWSVREVQVLVSLSFQDDRIKLLTSDSEPPRNG